MTLLEHSFSLENSINENFEKNFSQNQINNLSDNPMNDILSSSQIYENVGFEFDFDLNNIQELPKDQNNNEEKDNQVFTSTKITFPKIANKINDNKEIINIILEESKNENKNNGKKLGRKRKNEEREAFHTKDRDDNKMRKVKTYIMNFILDYLNKSIVYNRKQFLKINKNVNQCLRKDFNMSLMQMTIKDIFVQNKINETYNDFKKERNLNQDLIKEIFEKNEDIETIKILNMKYIDLVIIYRTEFLNQFISDLTKKEIRAEGKKEKVESYVEQLKYLLLNYEDWFEQKKGKDKIDN
jgi:hypothetical protein